MAQHYTHWHLYVLSNLLPLEAAKAETAYAKRIGTPFGSILLCSKTPYPPSTFQLIRFTLIEALTRHITIRPSQTPSVSTHHKRLLIHRTIATLDKRSRANHPVFNPPFFLFLFSIKENFQASFGNQLLSCEHLSLFHINVGIIVMHGNLSFRLNHLVSSMCLRQVFLGRLRDWVPICWLVTKGSCVTNLHLLTVYTGV